MTLVVSWVVSFFFFCPSPLAQAGGSVPGSAAAAPGAASTTGVQPNYSAAWAEYYRQQAAFYGQTGQAPSQPATPQQGQVGTEATEISILPF